MENNITPNYWVIFIQLDGTVIHMIAYEEPPAVRDVLHITEELRTDEEFGIGDLVDSLIMTIVKDGATAQECLKNIQPLGQQNDNQE